jgi:hypothetical protein
VTDDFECPGDGLDELHVRARGDEARDGRVPEILKPIEVRPLPPPLLIDRPLAEARVPKGFVQTS